MSLALSSVALLVAGQFGTITLTIADQTKYSFNAEQCRSTTPVNVRFQTAIVSQVCTGLSLFITDSSSCPDAPVANNDLVITPEVTQAILITNKNQNDTRDFKIGDLPYMKKFAADGGSACDATGVDVTHLLCASVSTSIDATCFSKTVLKAATPVTIHFDTKAPGAPNIDNAEGLDSSASVTVSADSDTSTVTVEYRTTPDGEWAFGATVTSGKTTEVINGLENGKEYELRAIANDAAGNTSEPSASVTVTPKLSAGFWSACVDAGCPPQGCSAASAAAPLLLGALALAMLRRRNRR